MLLDQLEAAGVLLDQLEAAVVLLDQLEEALVLLDPLKAPVVLLGPHGVADLTKIPLYFAHSVEPEDHPVLLELPPVLVLQNYQPPVTGLESFHQIHRSHHLVVSLHWLAGPPGHPAGPPGHPAGPPDHPAEHLL